MPMDQESRDILSNHCSLQPNFILFRNIINPPEQQILYHKRRIIIESLPDGAVV